VNISGFIDGTLIIGAVIILTHTVCMIIIVSKIDGIAKTIKDGNKESKK